MKKTVMVALILIVIFIVIFKALNIESLILKSLYPDTYSEHVDKYAKEYGIEREWVFALIKAESNFEKTSISQSGAIRTYAAYGKYCR